MLPVLDLLRVVAGAVLGASPGTVLVLLGLTVAVALLATAVLLVAAPGPDPVDVRGTGAVGAVPLRIASSDPDADGHRRSRAPGATA